MEIIKTPITGLKIVKPSVFKDARGYFFESYNRDTYKNMGIDCEFVQDNVSKSEYGVIRGLHFQKEEYAQAKLVQVLSGKVLDVAVDLRPESSTYGKSYSIELSEENQLQLFVPRGFAHGFSVLSEEVLFQYKCDNFYNKASEGGIIYNDADLNIDWGIPREEELISEKDMMLQKFKELKF
jgi:dTDP-4-dehydrorhamnose 3,5-epimerase